MSSQQTTVVVQSDAITELEIVDDVVSILQVVDREVTIIDFGEIGPQGPPGSPGAAATVGAGTTTTGAPGSNASVVNSGTSSAAVFDFTIPRGDVGATGPQGDDGIEIGAVAPVNTTVLWGDTTEPGDMVIPAGGTTGQVLAKASATDYDTTWQQPGLAWPPPVVGRFLAPHFEGVPSNTGLNNNEMQACAVFVPRSVTVNQISIIVTVAASAPAGGRLGIYSSNANGDPGSLLVDAGLYDATTTGTKTITLSPAVTLPQGVVFLVNCRQSTNSYQVSRSPLGTGIAQPTNATNGIVQVKSNWGKRQSGVSGALPASWTGTTVENGLILMSVRIASVL